MSSFNALPNLNSKNSNHLRSASTDSKNSSKEEESKINSSEEQVLTGDLNHDIYFDEHTKHFVRKGYILFDSIYMNLSCSTVRQRDGKVYPVIYFRILDEDTSGEAEYRKIMQAVNAIALI